MSPDHACSFGGGGEVEIRVIAAGLNFRSVLLALGMMPTLAGRWC